MKNRIRYWRKKRRLTQKGLEAISGVSHAQISRLETEASGFSKESLQALAKALQVTVADLVDLEPDEIPELAEVKAIMESLDPDERRRLVGMLHAFARPAKQA